MRERGNPFLVYNDEVEILPPEVKVNPFKYLTERVKKLEKNYTDYLGYFGGVFLDKGTLKATINDNEDGDIIRGLHFTQHSFSQLCNKIGVPSRYMIKCLETEGMDRLALENINSWIAKQEQKELLIRTSGSNIRGVLSNRFSILDAPEVMEVIVKVFGDKDFTIRGSVVNDERFHVRFTESKPFGIDDLFFGVQIDTSDVGISPLTVYFFIYKQVCTNGLVVSKFGGELFRQKHIGITSEVFERELVASVSGFPKLVEEMKARIMLMQKSILKPSDLEIGEEMSRLMMNFKQRTGLGDKVLAEVVELVPKYGMNQWGLVNAITEVAQGYNLNRRMQLEDFASSLLVA